MWRRVHCERTQYQLIELFYDDETGHVRLDLNCCTQFHSADEYRYHELAIHTALVLCEHEPKKVLILGGGDGLAAREALKFADIVHVVDIDSGVTNLATENELISALNENAFKDKRVKLYNKDAYEWIKKCRDNKYDICFADYPDPTSPTLEKLFSLEHYAEIKRVLRPGGVLVVQSGGALQLPLMANVGSKIRKLFNYAIPLKLEMIRGLQGFWVGCDEAKPHWGRLDQIKTLAFDKQMFLSATSWSKDLRSELLKGDPRQSAYDMLVYSLCLLEHLGYREGPGWQA